MAAALGPVTVPRRIAWIGTCAVARRLPSWVVPARLASHRTVCLRCQAEALAAEGMSRELATLARVTESAPPALADRVLAAVAAGRTRPLGPIGPTTVRRRTTRARFAAIGAGVVAAAALIVARRVTPGRIASGA